MTAIRRGGAVLRAVLAAVVLIALVAGVPVLLLATVGNPVPEGWAWSEPLTNTAILGALAGVAWVLWAQLLVCVVVEIIAEVRLAAGRSADWLSRVPGTLSGQQALARTLVQAVVAVGVTTVTAASTTPWTPHAAAAAASPPAPAARLSPDATRLAADPSSTARRSTSVEVIVARGDTLWSIAERHLGAGERWREIAELNRGRAMGDGARFEEARTIMPGWRLLVPAGSRHQTRQHVVTVERGDTLWELAEDAYDNGAQWPTIFRANEQAIEDPHWIYPGQEFVVPDQPRVSPRHAARQETAPVPGTHVDTPERNPLPTNEPTPPIERGPHAATTPVPPPTTTTEPAADPGEGSDEPSLHIDGATVTRALLSGGGFLAAGLVAVYIGRRRTQSRNRRSGKAAPPVAPHLRPDHKALRGIGSSASRRMAFFDAALRELASLAEADSFDLPEVVAARIDGSQVDLRLRVPMSSAVSPWTASPGGLTWSLPTRHRPVPTERMAPYPALVTLGDDAEGGTWFIDLEGAGVTQVVGPAAATDDLARYIAAELAVNPWSDFEAVDIVGPAQDAVPFNQGRLFAAPKLDIEGLIKRTRRIAENLAASHRTVLASRVTDWHDAWVPTLCIASIEEDELDLTRVRMEALLDDMQQVSGRSSIALVAFSPSAVDPRATTLEVTADGRLLTPWGLIRPNRLTADEAAVLGQLFDDADTEGDVDIPPVLDANGEPTDVDRSGALAERLTESRCGTGDPDSVLPRPDQAYLESAATTVEDLAALAPVVPTSLEAAAIAADPTLDQDLAAWADPESLRPKLRVLGPVELHAVGETSKEVESRPAYFAELAAYLACHPEGVTPNQVAAVFGIQNNTLHTRLGQLRKWMGRRPDGDEWHLPAAERIRGRQVYRISGLLCDAGLFRRLRARGEARGPVGIDDFQKALGLVAGMPYDQQRPNGYAWLADSPEDHYLTAAIVDVAHVCVTHALAEGNPRLALWAAEKAISAAPSEDKPRLDLARATQAIGDDAEAQRCARQEVLNRTDDDRAPLDASARTVEVLSRIDQRGLR